MDAKNPAGRQVVIDLARTADVFVQNYRPGVMARLGLDYDDLKAVNPDLIYVSMSGWGEAGPYAAKPVYDPIIQALSGLASVQAGSDHDRPRLIRTVLPDKLTGVTAAQAVSAALFARERTGAGQHVRLSMLDSVVAFLWSTDMGSQTFVGKETDVARAATFIDLIYETASGYISVSVMANDQWHGLCHAVGHPEWLDDERFKTPAGRDRYADERLELIQQALLTRTAEEWLELLEAAGVPCAPVLTRAEMIRHAPGGGQRHRRRDRPSPRRPTSPGAQCRPVRHHCPGNPLRRPAPRRTHHGTSSRTSATTPRNARAS